MKTLISALMLLAGMAALADTTITYDDGSKVLVKDDMVMFGDAEGGVLYDGEKNTMTMIQHQQKQYMVMDEAFADSVSGQISAAMKQMEAQLAQMPPEQRAMMEKMMRERMPGSAQKVHHEFRQTGSSQEIAGYDCDDGELLKNGKVEVQLCVASVRELGIPKDDYESMGAAFTAMAALVEKFSMGGEEMFSLELIGGVPVQSTDPGGHQNSRLAEISFDSIDDQQLAIPADYERKDPTQGM